MGSKAESFVEGPIDLDDLVPAQMGGTGPSPCRLSLQLKYLPALCAFMLLFLLLALHSVSSFGNLKTSPFKTEEIISVNQIRKKLEIVRQCILRESKRFEGSVWQLLNVITNTCALNAQLRLPYIKLKSDKSFLPFRISPPTTCNSVTLGVGNEISYERILQEHYPTCQLYGADPYPETGEIFKSVGQIFYTAIDNATGHGHLNVMQNGTYDWQDGIRITSLGDFLRKMAQISVIHFLSMDIEGAEYRVIPYMTKSGAFGDESRNAVICQISAEFHGPLSYYNITSPEFESIWRKLLIDSPYVPLRALPPGYHHRFHLFNVESDECMRLFLV